MLHFLISPVGDHSYKISHEYLGIESYYYISYGENRPTRIFVAVMYANVAAAAALFRANNSVIARVDRRNNSARFKR